MNNTAAHFNACLGPLKIGDGHVEIVPFPSLQGPCVALRHWTPKGSLHVRATPEQLRAIAHAYIQAADLADRHAKK